MDDYQLPIMVSHALSLPDNVTLPMPPEPSPSSPDSPALEKDRESLSFSLGPPSFNLPTSDAPFNLSPLAPSRDNRWDPETTSLGTITSPSAPAAQSNGSRNLLYIGTPPHSPGRESSPSSLQTTPQLAGTQLQRIASITKHTRSGSVPMGFTGDKGQDKKGGAVALFSSLFSAKGATEQEHPVTAGSTVTPVLLPSAVARPRSGSTLSVQSYNSNKGFFNSIGSSLGNAIPKNISVNGSLPGSPSRSSQRSMRAYSPELGPTILIDEFAGISFRNLLNSFIQEPEGTPEGRLEELATTAGDLLERVYEAYKSRTNALGDMLDEQEITKEVLEESRIKTSEYKMQLGRLANEERIVREEQQVRLAEQEKRIRELESGLQRERAKREELEGELERRTTLRGNKRASAASDSGFESDTESMFSRASQVISPVDSLMDGGVDDRKENLTLSTSNKCEHCATRNLSPSSASIRNPTPLSQAWSPGPGGSATHTHTQAPVTSPATKWGFAALTRRCPSGWTGNNDTDVRAENRMLRVRVGELEAVVNDVLEVIAGRERNV